jgi:cytochrome c5
VAYRDDEIKALVAYVGSLCDQKISDCPPIPAVDTERTTLDDGSALFLANCAPCHNSVAVGGALSYGRHAPSLQETPSLQVAEAIRTGPGQMPKFGHDVFSDEQVDAIVKYAEYLREPEHPGGLSLGYTGPVAEGFVALLIGLGALILGIRWITREPDEPGEPGPIGAQGGPGVGVEPDAGDEPDPDRGSDDERGALEEPKESDGPSGSAEPSEVVPS